MFKELFLGPLRTAILGPSVIQLKFNPGDIDKVEILPGSNVKCENNTLRIPDRGRAALAINDTWVGISDEVKHHLPDGSILYPVATVIIKEPGSEDDPQRIRVTSGESMAMPLGGLPVVVTKFKDKHKRSR